VDAGIMAGAANRSAIPTALRRILYDEEFRLQIERERSVYLRRHGITASGQAASRAADAVTRLAAPASDLAGGGR